MGQSVTLADLRRAAQVAREVGVAVAIEGADGKTFRIYPDATPSPLGATEREADECDKLFGLSG